MAEEDTSNNTSSKDYRDYNFGKVGDTTNYYINLTSTEIQPAYRNNYESDSVAWNASTYWAHCSSTGFTSGRFPKEFIRPYNNLPNAGKLIDTTCWEGWSLARRTHQQILDDQYISEKAKKCYKHFVERTGWKDYGMQSWRDDTTRYITRTKIVIKIADILPDSIDRASNDIEYIKFETLLRNDGGLPDYGFQHIRVIYQPLVFDSNGDPTEFDGFDNSGSRDVYNFEYAYFNTESITDSRNFEIPIYPGQEEIIFDIVCIGPDTTEAAYYNIFMDRYNGPNGSYKDFRYWGWYCFWLYARAIGYKPKPEIYSSSATNRKQIFLSSKDFFGSVDNYSATTLYNREIGGGSSNEATGGLVPSQYSEIWPYKYEDEKNKIPYTDENGYSLLQLEANTVSTLIESGRDKTISIFVNWLSGEFYGNYQINNKTYFLRVIGDYFSNKFSNIQDLVEFRFYPANLTIDPENPEDIPDTDCPLEFAIYPPKRQIQKIPVIIDNNSYNCTITNQIEDFGVLTTANELQKDIAKLRSDLAKIKENAEYVNLIFNVGDYWTTENNTNPGIRFGGTWTLVTDRFLLGTDEGSKIGNEGGSNTLTVEQLPEHKHISPFAENDGERWNSRWGSYNVPTGLGTNGGWDWDNWIAPYTSPIGEDKPHQHPYRYVYLWRKTSNEADPTLNNFTTPINYRYLVMADNSPIGQIGIKTKEELSESPTKDDWLVCNGSSFKPEQNEYTLLKEYITLNGAKTSNNDYVFNNGLKLSNTGTITLPTMSLENNKTKSYKIKRFINLPKTYTNQTEIDTNISATLKALNTYTDGTFNSNTEYALGHYDIGMPNGGYISRESNKINYINYFGCLNHTSNGAGTYNYIGNAFNFKRPFAYTNSAPENWNRLSCWTYRFNLGHLYGDFDVNNYLVCQTNVKIDFNNIELADKNGNTVSISNNIKSLNMFIKLFTEVYQTHRKLRISIFKTPIGPNGTNINYEDIDIADVIPLIHEAKGCVDDGDIGFGNNINIPITQKDIENGGFNLCFEFGGFPWTTQTDWGRNVAFNADMYTVFNFNSVELAEVEENNNAYYCLKADNTAARNETSFIKSYSALYKNNSGITVLEKETANNYLLRGTNLFFTNNLFAGVSPTTAARTVLSYYCINKDNDKIKTLYKFVFNWRSKAFTFYTDDISNTSYQKSTNKDGSFNMAISEAGWKPRSDGSALKFDNVYNIKSLPVVPNCSVVDIFECNTYLI